PPNGSVPIIVGGDSKVAARRAGRLGDGYFPARGAPEDLFQIVRDTAVEHGRDPDAIEFSVSIPDDPDEIPRLAALGVKRVLVSVSPMAGMPAKVKQAEDALKWKDMIEKYADC
ncbi:MAG: LLM class flavin-dependent oxidoreductase, partial [Pseudomonadota bacterium]